jgi:hypothetical protein
VENTILRGRCVTKDSVTEVELAQRVMKTRKIICPVSSYIIFWKSLAWNNSSTHTSHCLCYNKSVLTSCLYTNFCTLCTQGFALVCSCVEHHKTLSVIPVFSETLLLCKVVMSEGNVEKDLLPTDISFETFSCGLLTVSIRSVSSLIVVQISTHLVSCCGKFAEERYLMGLLKTTNLPFMIWCQMIPVLRTWRKWFVLTSRGQICPTDGLPIR